jgi:hypothetical protein
MGFFADILSSTVKVALAPISIVKDVVNIATGQEPDATKDLLQSAGEDLSDAVDEACGG